MEPVVGMIYFGAWNFAPRGFAFCDGQLLSIADNLALFSIIETTYGGDGMVNFALPDLRGRCAVHSGKGQDLTQRNLGQKGGLESVALTNAQIWRHGHHIGVGLEGGSNNPVGRIAAGNYGTGDQPGPMRAYSEETNGTMHPDMVAPVGRGESHENMPPFLAMNFIIALTGIFPSRH